jgi:hypothetical protein
MGGIKICMFNNAFSVRKCMVKQKEKIMIASYGETSGFTPVSDDEQTAVNGGFPWDIVLGMAGAVGAILMFSYVISQPKKNTK